MARTGRILLLGVVAVGIVLALTTGISGSRTLGQATGYGSDTVPPSQLEIGAPANNASTGGGGGSHLLLILGGGLVIVLLGGAGAFFYSRSRHHGWD